MKSWIKDEKVISSPIICLMVNEDGLTHYSGIIILNLDSFIANRKPMKILSYDSLRGFHNHSRVVDIFF